VTDRVPGPVGGAARLLLLRHGRTAWNATGRFQGHADIPLDDLGLAQAGVAAEALRPVRIDEVWASDLARARETARIAVDGRGLPVRTDPALREIHVGEWEGLTAAEVVARDPDFGRRYLAGEDVRRSATGETTSEVGHRVAAALRTITERAADDATVLVGTHGIAAMTGALAFLGLDHGQWLRFASLTNCHWIDLRRSADRPWRIHGWNVGPQGLVDGERMVRPAEQELVGGHDAVDVTAAGSSG